MWDDLTIGYLAGLYDGEGHCGVSKHQAMLTIDSTDEDIVTRAFHMSGVGKIYGPYFSKRVNEKPIWRWRITSNKELVRMLTAITPLLCERRRQQLIPVIEWLYTQIPRPKSCARCGEEFLPTGKSGNLINRIYCSQHCNYGAWYYRQKDLQCLVPQ